MISTLRPSGLSRVVNERNGRTAPTRWGCTLPPPRRLSAPGRAAARWPLLTMRGGGDSGAGNAPVALRLRSANPTGPVAGDAESTRSRAATFSDTMGPVPSAQCPSDARRKPAPRGGSLRRAPPRTSGSRPGVPYSTLDGTRFRLYYRSRYSFSKISY